MTSAYYSSGVNNYTSRIALSDGNSRISVTEWLLSVTRVFLSSSRAIWRVPCWIRTVDSAGTLRRVYIHSLIHLAHNGDGGALGNEAFTSSPRPICLQWAVAAQMEIAEKIYSSSLLVSQLGRV